MSAIKKYEAYIDSGFEWLGEIPASWSMALLSQIAIQIKNKNAEFLERNLLSLSYGQIKRKSIDATDGLLPESFDGYNIIEKNDIVLRLTDLQNDHRSLRVGLATERGIITSAYITIRPRNQESAKYLYYLLHTFDIRKGFYGMGSGVRQGLNYDEVKKLKLPLPTLVEQIEIVEYLEKETKRIDDIIAEATASIEEYKAWKTSVIYEAVTKGLDSSAEMKESGIEWIGQVPRDWSVVRLKYFVSGYKAGPFGSALITNQLNSNGNILVYTPEHIAKKTAELDNNLYLPDERCDEMQQFIVEPGDIIFPIVGSLGKSMLITEDMPTGIINQRLAKFRLNTEQLTMEYFLWLFSKSSFYSTFIELNCRGSIIVNLTKQIVYDIPIPLPEDIQKQQAICAYLEKKCGTINALIEEKKALISDLESYKKSLVFEVVTGKRRVCE